MQSCYGDDYSYLNASVGFSLEALCADSSKEKQERKTNV